LARDNDRRDDRRDYRAYNLSPPPRGHQWVQVGADCVLIATGLIANIILNY
jgi:Ni/Co efflux regulator RcnB